MLALPGIVDGARKSPQGGSLTSISEATTSSDKFTSAANAIAHHDTGTSSVFSTAQRASGLTQDMYGGGGGTMV